MTEQLERRLRAMFLEDAENAPPFGQLAARVVHRVHRRRTRLALTSGALAIVLTAIVAMSLLARDPTLRPDRPHPVATAPTSPAGGPATIGSGLADCPDIDADYVAARATFAFDGTVIAIGRTRVPTDDPAVPHVAVTLSVAEWFRGGSGARATVSMVNPSSAGGYGENGELGDSYAVGTRLLVSGKRLSGESVIGPAWVCGATRHWDQATRDAWRRAIRNR